MLMMMEILLITTLLILVNSGESLISTLPLVISTELLLYMIMLTMKWYHAMMLILILECMSMKLFFLFTSVNTLMFLSLYFLLVVMVIEASLGMSLLIKTMRSGLQSV